MLKLMSMLVQAKSYLSWLVKQSKDERLKDKENLMQGYKVLKVKRKI